MRVWLLARCCRPPIHGESNHSCLRSIPENGDFTTRPTTQELENPGLSAAESDSSRRASDHGGFSSLSSPCHQPSLCDYCQQCSRLLVLHRTRASDKTRNQLHSELQAWGQDGICIRCYNRCSIQMRHEATTGRVLGCCMD